MEANLFKRLQPSRSLVKKHLTKELFRQLQDCSTPSGFTLQQAVRSGIENPDSSIGIYAGDEETYRIFAPLLDPIILDYHQKARHRVEPDFKLPELTDPDPEGRFILSSRIRLARNLKGFSFPCHMPLRERRELEKRVASAVKALPKDLSGSYHSFEKTDATLLSQLKKGKLVFSIGDRFQDAAGLNTDFPKGRGVFHSDDRRFILWLNEEDHLRIISMERSASLAGVFRRVGRAIESLSRQLDFAWDPDKGFLTSCPTNIGTTMRAGVHIRLEKLEKRRDLLSSLAKQHHLQIRGTDGEKTAVQKAVFDISNRQRLGISESNIIRTLHTGLVAIIRAEKSL